MDHLVSVLADWVPPVIAAVVGVAVLALARWLLLMRRGGPVGEARVYRQLFLLVLIMAVVVGVVLTMPLGDESKTHVLGLLGILASAAVAFSSTSFVGNAMAGLMLRVVKSFRPGDFLLAKDEFGRVTELGLLHVEIQTPYRDLTTLPNLFLVNNPVTVVRRTGTFVHADVSLGYNVPRWRVEELLEQGALSSGLAEPFILIQELGSCSVSYRVAGFLREVRELVEARSDLRAHVLDALHEGGVEIVSPSFLNLRRPEGDYRFVPAEPRPSRPDHRDVPEEIIFDKAERAAKLDELHRELDELEERLEDLRHSAGQKKGASEDVRAEIERLEARRDRLRKVLLSEPE